MSSGKIVNCYWATWSYYRKGNCSFLPEHINPRLCTHLSYCFFGIDDLGKIKILDHWIDIDMKFIKQTIDLCRMNPTLKVIAVVGGWKEGSRKYSAMAADPQKSAAFVSSVMEFLKIHGFHGLEIDWEYPGQRGGRPDDRDNFVKLLRKLRDAFEPHNYELSIAVGAFNPSESYNVGEICKYVNYINLMTYDYHCAANGCLGFNAPLPKVKQTVKEWLARGAPAEKLILGLAFYGRSFTMGDQLNSLPGAHCSGVGKAGFYTGDPGTLSYYEICHNKWESVFDEETKCKYAYSGDQWVSYDDTQTVEYKTKLVLDLKLGGVMVWSVDCDYFVDKRYPMLRKVNEGLGRK